MTLNLMAYFRRLCSCCDFVYPVRGAPTVRICAVSKQNICHSNYKQSFCVSPLLVLIFNSNNLRYFSLLCLVYQSGELKRMFCKLTSLFWRSLLKNGKRGTLSRPPIAKSTCFSITPENAYFINSILHKT